VNHGSPKQQPLSVPSILSHTSWCDRHQTRHECERDHGPDGASASVICCPKCSPENPCDQVDDYHVQVFGECYVKSYDRIIALDGSVAHGVMATALPEPPHPDTLAGQMTALRTEARAFGREVVAQLRKLFAGPGAQWDAAMASAEHVGFMRRIAQALNPEADGNEPLPTEDVLVAHVRSWVKALGRARLVASEAVRVTEEYLASGPTDGPKMIHWSPGWAVHDTLHEIARIEPGERQAEAMAEGPWASQHIGQPMTDTCVLGCVLVGHHRYCMTLHGTDGGPPIRLPDGSVGYRFLIDGGERP
jgi:hypothetical protein